MPRGQATISLIDLFSAESPAATEFRRLLHNINGAYAAQVARQRGETNPDLQGIVKQLRRVMITSALGSEGKSTVASFLAISSARFKERRTLLVDADLRRPSIHQLFALERAGGLVEILSEGLAPRQAVKRTSLDRLDVITAGRLVENPSDIFDAGRIGSALDELAGEYEFITLDTPPIMPVSDPLLLADYVDGALLVVKAGETPRDVAVRAQTLMAGAGSPVLGVVLNNANSSLPYYYDAGYYEYEPERG